VRLAVPLVVGADAVDKAQGRSQYATLQRAELAFPGALFAATLGQIAENGIPRPARGAECCLANRETIGSVLNIPAEVTNTRVRPIVGSLLSRPAFFA